MLQVAMHSSYHRGRVSARLVNTEVNHSQMILFTGSGLVSLKLCGIALAPDLFK
jgi:hypothetical protein